MADKKIQLKDKDGNLLYPKTKGSVVTGYVELTLTNCIICPLSFGEYKVKFKIIPNSGYKLPDSITFGTEITTKSYDKTTGIVIFNNPDVDSTITINCPEEAFDPTAADWYKHTALCKTSDIGCLCSVMINGVEHHVRLIGIDHDDLADGSGKAHTTWQLEELLSDSAGAKITQVWKSATPNTYADADIRPYLNNTFKGYLPTDLQSKIKNVKKKTSLGNTSTTVSDFEETIFLLSLHEMASETGISNSSATWIKDYASTLNQEGTPYKYYNDVLGDSDPRSWNTTPYSNVTIKKDKSGAAGVWWLRSPRVDGTGIAFDVYYTGHVGYDYVGSAYGVAPAFCI